MYAATVGTRMHCTLESSRECAKGPFVLLTLIRHALGHGISASVPRRYHSWSANWPATIGIVCQAVGLSNPEHAEKAPVHETRGDLASRPHLLVARPQKRFEARRKFAQLRTQRDDIKRNIEHSVIDEERTVDELLVGR